MRPSRLSEYGSDHALSARFTLSTPLGFFMGLIRAKLGLTVEQGVALDLTCTLSERSQSSTSSSWLVFQVFDFSGFFFFCFFCLVRGEEKKSR